ncbi:MAG: hypothetical protein LBU51_03995 [Bacteroidales bacterium]|jgi:hypothetical protein|nr:hypothetical protein [Bacteroidales bacterium]
MEKILPVNRPPITAYMTHAPILSILANNDKYLPWFFLNYLQIRIHEDGADFYNFYTAHFSCPFLDTSYLPKQFISRHINTEITNFFTSCIDDNLYIISLINVSFIELYSQDYDNMHPIFIYGYNKDKEIFYVADFFIHGRFSFRETSFKEVSLAYENCDDTQHWQHGVHLLKPIEYNKKYSLIYFVDTLKRYLYGYEPSVGYNQNIDTKVEFGLNAFYDRLNKEIEQFKGNQRHDERIFAIFCEHKIVLRLLSEFLIKNGCEKFNELQREYNDLYEKSMTFRNNYLRYRLKRINSSYDGSRLFTLKDTEVHLLKRTINVLESYINDDMYF